MKFSTSSALLSAIVPMAAAFPMELMEKFQNDPQMQARAANMMVDKRQAGADSATAVFEGIPTFDAATQYVNVSKGSGHEWQAPGPKDLRGVCPGLNAFANHGFLPRNGYATVAQFIDATTKVVGMGPDLAAFLSVLGALIDSGDLNAWSIGGTPPVGVGSAAAQNGHGLIGSHNKYENDVSPTRPDLYESGNNYITQADQFQDLINASPGGVVTLDSLTTYRSQRFDRQIANNPYFFNAPFPGLLVQPAAFTFIYRFMANHSAENPIGTLTYDVIQSWFGIKGKSGSYTAPFGHERIPENWYRRSQSAPYTIPYFLGDVVAAAALHPKFLDIGGNLGGKTNNFAGVEVANLTAGLFNSAQLLEGNNLGCFAFQVVDQVKADLVLLDLLNQLTDLVANVVSALGCPQLQKIDESALKTYPGYNKSPEFSSSSPNVSSSASNPFLRRLPCIYNFTATYLSPSLTCLHMLVRLSDDDVTPHQRKVRKCRRLGARLDHSPWSADPEKPEVRIDRFGGLPRPVIVISAGRPGQVEHRLGRQARAASSSSSSSSASASSFFFSAAATSVACPKAVFVHSVVRDITFTLFVGEEAIMIGDDVAFHPSFSVGVPYERSQDLASREERWRRA
nr:aromatic peroxygenase [Quercus suber]